MTDSARAAALHIAAHEVFAVEATGEGRFVGAAYAYPWGLFGGHVLAQSLLAAGATVDPCFVPRAIHAGFLRRGRGSAPVTYEVERTHDGRSYCTRRVVGRQSGHALMAAQVSFVTPRDGLSPISPMTTDVPVPAADHIGSSPWTTAFSRVEVPTERSGHVRWWYRFAEPIGDAPLYQAAALAYLTDDVPGEAVMDAHDRPPVNRFENGEWIGASLDHALWFHAPVQVDAWHLHDVRCISYAGGRGLSIGTIFAADGTHVATVSQEGHLVPRLVGAP